MRITNGILQRTALEGLQSNLQRLERARRQVSSGLRVERPSDDPVAAGGILRASGRLRAIEQYSRNLSTARSRLDTEQTVLDQVGDVLSRARELGFSQLGPMTNGASLAATREEIDELLTFVRGLGNTRFEGAYFFGGANSGIRPFPDGGGPDPLLPPEGERPIEGGEGQIYLTNHSGTEVFVDSGVLSALETMSAALTSGSATDIAQATEDLETAFDNIQALMAELGARMNQIDNAASNLESLEVNLRTFRSDLQDAELEEVVTELVNRQVAYQAALAANQRILDLTLTDYL